MLNFKPAFSLSSFSLIKRLFISSSIFAIQLVSFTYVRLFIFLPAMLIPACDSPSLSFHLMYPAQKLNKQGDNIQPMYSFPNFEPVHFSKSGSNCCFLTRIQISQETGKLFCYSHLFQNAPQFVVIHTVQGFSVVNEAEVGVFLELSYFLHDPANVGNLIFVLLPFGNPACTSESSQFAYC